jgi:hypothetical protein
MYDETDDRIKLEADSNNVKNAILTIDVARIEDRNTYTCIASNKASSKYPDKIVSSETYVRVKGKRYLKNKTLQIYSRSDSIVFRKISRLMAIFGHLC